MVIINLKTESQIVNRKKNLTPKLQTQINIPPFPGLAQTVACVASVSVQFGSKELQDDEWSE